MPLLSRDRRPNAAGGDPMTPQRHDRPLPRCPSAMSMSAALPGRPDQVPVARRLVAEVLRGCPAGGNATVIANELVTNAVMHSASGRGGRFSVTVTHRAADVRGEVTDQGGGPWSLRHRPSAEHGRGLLIV